MCGVVIWFGDFVLKYVLFVYDFVVYFDEGVFVGYGGSEFECGLYDVVW